VWLHDYGKIVDHRNEYAATAAAAPAALAACGVPVSRLETAIRYVEMADRCQVIDLRSAPIGVQILSSADGCAHMVGPFYSLWWKENSDKHHDELMADNRAKLAKDWNHKITLPEARTAFAAQKCAIEQLIINDPTRRYLGGHGDAVIEC